MFNFDVFKGFLILTESIRPNSQKCGKYANLGVHLNYFVMFFARTFQLVHLLSEKYSVWSLTL